MPALDDCHPQMVRALEKQGWITGKPSALVGADGYLIYIDISAELPTQAGKRYIEVKCFPRRNKSQELHIAFGQYVLYRAFLVKWKVDATVYLAVPTTAYEQLFGETVLQAVNDNDIKLIIVDLETEEIIQWNE